MTAQNSGKESYMTSTPKRLRQSNLVPPAVPCCPLGCAPALIWYPPAVQERFKTIWEGEITSASYHASQDILGK